MLATNLLVFDACERASGRQLAVYAMDERLKPADVPCHRCPLLGYVEGGRILEMQSSNVQLRTIWQLRITDNEFELYAKGYYRFYSCDIYLFEGWVCLQRRRFL